MKVEHKNTIFKQHSLLVLSLRVKQTTIKEINNLHFLLNIDTFFPTIHVKSLVPGSQSNTSSREFAPLYLVLKLLSKLQTFSSETIYEFITVKLGLYFDGRINKISPIFVQWAYLHWFLKFPYPVALFPVKGGHCIMAIMKFISCL